MNDQTEHERLLAEVLTEEAPSHFDEVVLAGTLRALRARKRNRQLVRGAACATAVALTVILGFRLRPARPVVTTAETPSTTSRPLIEIIESRPLPASMLITTRTITIPLVKPGRSIQMYQKISDAELLELAGNDGAILIRGGAGQSEHLVGPTIFALE